jgi:hypothetical protein
MPRKVRPIKIEGNTARISLTMGYEAVVDAVDVPALTGRNWYAKVARRADGTVRSVYATTKICDDNGVRRRVYMHQVLMPVAAGYCVDHVDSDGLNNCRANLRAVTPSQNMQNKRVAVTSSSGVKGVFWHSANKRWHAQIAKGGVQRFLGYFDTIDDAAAAYAKASAATHGEFGSLTPTGRLAVEALRRVME